MDLTLSTGESKYSQNRVYAQIEAPGNGWFRCLNKGDLQHWLQHWLAPPEEESYAASCRFLFYIQDHFSPCRFSRSQCIHLPNACSHPVLADHGVPGMVSLATSYGICYRAPTNFGRLAFAK